MLVKRKALAVFVIITLILAILLAIFAQSSLVSANLGFPTLPFITIKSNGAIEPTGIPIAQVGNVYYFTRDISNYTIRIECDNIIVDGQGFTLQGNKTIDEIIGDGFYLVNRNNVTIRNLNIKSYDHGIALIANYQTSQLNTGINIINNIITDCDTGILFDSAVNDHIIGNKILNNDYGINIIWESSFNTIRENLITNNAEDGIYVGKGSNNTFALNTISENKNGVRLDCSDDNVFMANSIERNDFGFLFPVPLVGTSNDNLFYDNNIIHNVRPVYEEIHQNMSQLQRNFWDNGGRGNYWSDYLTKYPNATEIDSSGIGDTPYVINANNTDNYPLMAPVDVPRLTIDFPPPIFTPTPTLAPTPTPTPTPTSKSTPSPSLPQETESPSEPEPFPTTLVIASIITVAVVGIGLLVYFKKRRAKSGDEV
jgi:parallel beta-helix repeat protein